MGTYRTAGPWCHGGMVPGFRESLCMLLAQHAPLQGENRTWHPAGSLPCEGKGEALLDGGLA